MSPRRRRSGRTVLGIDLKTFQAGMDRTDDTCSFPVNDLEAVSQQVQKDLPFSQYRPPALTGIGAGAALAYAAITDSLPGTFSAGIGLDFCPVYLAPRPFCPDAPTTTRPRGRAVQVRGGGEVQTPWMATAKPGCPADLTAAVMDHTPKAVRLDAAGPMGQRGHDGAGQAWRRRVDIGDCGHSRGRDSGWNGLRPRQGPLRR